MRHNVIETTMGALVLAGAALFLVFAMRTVDVRTTEGYPVTAAFSTANGLIIGADVRIGGVKVGSVDALSLDPESFQAVVTIMLKNGLSLPKDSSATIRSESLMGGKFLAIEPGGDENVLKAGDRIQYTQSTPDLEQLLGQAIFSMSQAGKDESADKATPAPAPSAQ